MKNIEKGFTLIELLVVIAVLAVLATAVVLVLNPAELVRQGRDSTRMSDLAALNSAISLWLSDVSTSTWVSAARRCTSSTSDTNTCPNSPSPSVVTSTATDGTGWVNLNFALISSGSPLSKLPIDPNNGAAGCRTSVTTSTCQYSFAASSTLGYYELTAAMESQRYSNGGSSDVVSKDGGTASYLYEVGSNLNL